MSDDSNPFVATPNNPQGEPKGEPEDNPFASAADNRAETNPWGNAEPASDNDQTESWLQDDSVKEAVEFTLADPFPEAWVPLQEAAAWRSVQHWGWLYWVPSAPGVKP